MPFNQIGYIEGYKPTRLSFYKRNKREILVLAFVAVLFLASLFIHLHVEPTLTPNV